MFLIIVFKIFIDLNNLKLIIIMDYGQKLRELNARKLVYSN